MTQTCPLGTQISHALHARGVDVIFGIPGVHNVEMYRGIEQSGIRHILARHEQGAGFMADGYARATGKPGVAYVITGPGLTNIMTPMGQAYSDSVPMLVISSCLNRSDGRMDHARLHDMLDQEGAAACVAAWSHTAPDATGAYELIDRAFSGFASARKRPVHIQVPIDVGAALAPGAPPPLAMVGLPVPDLAKVKQVAALLRSARTPLLVLGGGARGAWVEARALVGLAGCAVFPTYAGRGIVPDAHASSFGANLTRPSSAAVLNQADLLLVIGSELAETDIWRDELGHGCPMVRVDIDPRSLSDRWRAEIAILSEAKAFLAALVLELSGHVPDTAWRAEQITAAKLAWRGEVDAECPGAMAMADALRECLPENTMIYSDMTQFAYVSLDIWPMSYPGLWHHPYGFGTLGYALPAAIGGKIGRGEAPVIAIAGDYGFQFTMQELGVAVELDLNLPIILWDNGKLLEIEASMIRSQIAPNAVVARNPEFAKLAEAFGAKSAAPRSIGTFQMAVREAFKAGGPTLIHVTPETGLA